MPSSKATLITHPVRARILMTLMGRRLTTQQIADLLPDVPKPSLYRHLRLLAESGILTAAAEIPVRGTFEKVYAVQEGGRAMSPADTEGATRDDQLRYFTTFLAALQDSFNAYLGREESNWDQVSCRATPLYLSDTERREFLNGLQALLKPLCANTPTPERRRLLFSTILLPDKPDPQTPDDTTKIED